jgi:hypothetical protein
MATFPESSPAPRYPLTVEPEFNTLISGFDGGGEQRRKKLLYPKYNVVVKYDEISVSEARTLWEFYIARSGAYEVFYIYDLALLFDHSFNHVGEYCGTGDGSTTVFDIPGRSTSSRTVYSDGVDVTSDVSFLTGGGTSSSDRVQFSFAPIAGKIITIDFTGYLRMRVRFLEDKLPRQNFIFKLYQYGIKLKGLSSA